MLTVAARIARPKLILFLLLCAVTQRGFGQSYTPNPNYLTVDLIFSNVGTETAASGTSGVLPSRSCNGATVTFKLATTIDAYEGGGAGFFEYESDLIPEWTVIAGQTETTGFSPYSHSVSVSNLASLRFRVAMTGTIGGSGGGYFSGGVTVENISVTPH